jgi:hypothetical protein
MEVWLVLPKILHNESQVMTLSYGLQLDGFPARDDTQVTLYLVEEGGRYLRRATWLDGAVTCGFQHRHTLSILGRTSFWENCMKELLDKHSGSGLDIIWGDCCCDLTTISL